MRTSPEIREKIVRLIGNLICHCIHEARMIPYILKQEEIINILVEDPALFQKLVQREHADRIEYSKKDLTVKLDAVAELGRLESLDAFDNPFWVGPEVDLSPLMDLTNQLTRTFAVYINNASALFDKAFEEFMKKFRRSLQKSGMTLMAIDLTQEDVKKLGENARSYVSTGELLQAFTYDRLLGTNTLIPQVVNFPPENFPVSKDLVRESLEDPGSCSMLIKFILRVSYVSQGHWGDLFSILVRLVYRGCGLCSPSQLIDFIEQDVMCTCNLLCESYAEIRRLSAPERRSAIENKLERYIDKTGPLRLASQDP